MPGAVRARLGTGARHTARPVEPEQTMTRAKTANAFATNGATPQRVGDASTSKTTRSPGNAAAATEQIAAAPEKAGPASRPTTPATSAPKLLRQTKAAMIRARLAESGGVSLAALIEATGWQAHTLRAAMSGLRKEGLTLTRRREGKDAIYAIDHGGPAAAKMAGAGTGEESAPEASHAAMSADREAGAVHPTAVSRPAESNA
jgi:hypothetical protein